MAHARLTTSFTTLLITSINIHLRFIGKFIIMSRTPRTNGRKRKNPADNQIKSTNSIYYSNIEQRFAEPKLYP
jgi:hypothetical protein